MNPQEAQELFNTVVSKGVWGLLVFMVIVHVVGQYILIRMFKSMLDAKDASVERLVEVFNRRTMADNARTELEAIQMSSRPDLHPVLKEAVQEVVRKTKNEQEHK